MSQRELEQVLADLPAQGRCIKRRAYRQVWRFEADGRPYFLKFYPRAGWRDFLRRRFRGNPAQREFYRLQWLQKARVPAPRAVATLVGFQLDGVKGDAVLIGGIEPSVQLDACLSDLALRGEAIPEHRRLSASLADLLSKLAAGGLTHRDLHLGNLLLKDGELHLLDGYAVQRGGLSMHDVLLLALSADPYATRTDKLRVWKAIAPRRGEFPPENPRGPAVWRSLARRALREDSYFGRLEIGHWSGHYFKQAKFPQRHAPASSMHISREDWEKTWPTLLAQIESDQFEVLKRSPSGDVLAGEIVLSGRPISVVVKRPRRKYWYRWLTEIGRGGRPRRAWKRAWHLIVRNIPTAWPLTMMEYRRGGYATDALIIFERVDGKVLADVDWRSADLHWAATLLQRCGRLLAKLERSGLHLYDSKAQNWMFREDEKLGPTPLLIDVDGVRFIRQRGGGLPRLLRSLRAMPGFSAEHERALMLGYAPFAKTSAQVVCNAARGGVPRAHHTA